MKIVVLDGQALNPGDLSWEPFEKLSDGLSVYERSARDEVVERAFDADIILTNKSVIDANIISRLPKLKYIGVLATGTNVVDIDAANSRGITVSNVVDYGSQSVAQMTFALILALCRRVEFHSRLVSENRWANSPDFCFWESPQIDLEDRVLGIVGFGSIGKAVARIACAFGMEVLVNRRNPSGDCGENYTFVDRDTLFRQSDIVSLHCPLTDETDKLVDSNRLKSMKKSSFLINTARGGLIDEEALKSALKSKSIAGAGLDVLGSEPPPENHSLYDCPNCIITPHIAWASLKARDRLLRMAASNLEKWLKENGSN